MYADADIGIIEVVGTNAVTQLRQARSQQMHRLHTHTYTHTRARTHMRIMQQ